MMFYALRHYVDSFVGTGENAPEEIACGHNMPTRAELIATGRTDDGIAREIGADALVYQDIDALKQSVTGIRSDLTDFEASCFDGCYITGDVDEDCLDAVEGNRGKKSGDHEDGGDGQSAQQLVLQLVSQAGNSASGPNSCAPLPSRATTRPRRSSRRRFPP